MASHQSGSDLRLAHAVVGMALLLAGTSACQPAGVCKVSADCNGDEVCFDKHCHRRCAALTDCGDGASCVQGACVALGASCAGAADCFSFERCVAGRCQMLCADSRDCRDDMVCANGSCTLRQDGGPGDSGQRDARRDAARPDAGIHDQAVPDAGARRDTGDGSSVGVAPTADFYATPLVGPAPLMTDFISTSTGTRPMTFEWDFNNTGYIGSTEEHPPIETGYTVVGYHSVALTVTNAYGSDKMVKIDYINVLPPTAGTPVADFIASPTTGAPPLTVQFTDTSTGSPTSWAWSFGDGSTSTLQSPSHVYTTAGTYAVSLVATNANGSNTMTKSGFIVIGTGGGETYGAEEGNDTGSPIGGGAGYQHIVTSGDFTVTTLEELKTALGAAQPFDVIFIPGDVTIDIASESSALVIPPEVTLASNRGYDGGSGASLGGRILRSSNDAMGTGWSRLGSLSPSGNGVRITGLRIEGADDSYTYVYPENQITGAIWTSATITNLEVDNCEIYHWSYGAVSCFGCGHSMHIHHCSIHNIGGNTEIGYGYGCASAGHEGGCGGGWMLVEANLFNYVRHAVMSSGYPGDGYEARFNIHGIYNSDTTYDVHASGSHMGDWDGTPSGRLFQVHHNTAPSPVDGDQFMGYVAPPSEGMNIYNNRMGNGVYCPHGYDRLNMTNNYIGGVFHASGQ